MPHMHSRLLALMAFAFLLPACGQRGDSAADAVSAPAEAINIEKSERVAQSSSAAVVLPQLAYSYKLAYRLPSASVTKAMSAHRKLCSELGLGSCRLLAENLSSGDGHFVTGSLTFEVEAPRSRTFTDQLDAVISGVDGEISDRRVEAEDMARPIIDAESRISAKQMLADRLLELLKRKDGKVGELIEVERAFADAQQELEATRGALADMKRRVAMSRVTISYQSDSLGGASSSRQITDAFASAGRKASGSAAALIGLVALLLPWAVALSLFAWGAIRLKRWRARARKQPEAPEQG